MDHLKKILVHQFWILLAVALILPLVAWFMAHSSMVATAAARRDKIETAYKNLPSASNPNETWTREVEQINERQRVSNAAALELMTSAQLQPSVRWWPANVSGNWDKLSNAEEYTQLQTYRNNYVNEFKRVFNLVHPITDNSMTGMPQTGKVEIQESAISPQHVFTSASPTLKQVLATQEDLWLLEALLKAIDRLNEGAKTQNEALVRRIEELTLRGGGGAKGGATAGSGGAVGANPMMPNGAAATPGGMPTDGMPVAGNSPFGGGGGGGSSLGSADFNADEVIGAEVDDPTEASSTPAGGPAAGGAIGAMANPAAAGFGGTSSSSAKKGRYVEENDKWKQRAFKLRVVMLHHRLPDLLVELTNIPNFPVKILRVNQVDRTTEELKDLPNAIPSGGPAGGPPGYGAAVAPTGVAPGGAQGFGQRGAFNGPGPMGAPAGGVGSEFSQGTSGQSAAMTDPQLADVAILGVITLFKEPPATEVAGAAPAAGAPAAAPAAPASVPTTPPGVPSAAPAAPSAIPSAVPGPADIAPVTETAPGPTPAAESARPSEGAPATPPSGAPPATPQEPPKVP